MCDSIGVDQMAAEFYKHRADGALASGNTPSQADSKHQRPRHIRAALLVFFISMAIVIGPTPPETGVIIETTSFTERSSTSPAQMYPRFSKSLSRGSSLPKSLSTWAGSETLFVPTSITTAPGLTHSRVTIAVLPIAATRISAWRVISGR